MTDTYELVKDSRGYKNVVAALLEFKNISNHPAGGAKFRREFLRRYNIDPTEDRFINPFFQMVDRQGKPIVKFRSLMDKIQAVQNERRGQRITSTQMWDRLEELGNDAPRPTLKDKEPPEEDPLKLENEEGEELGSLEEKVEDPLKLENEDVATLLGEKRDPQVGAYNILSNAKTFTDIKRGIVSLGTRGDAYTGSGTPVIQFLKMGVKPKSNLDLIALEHDIRYTTAIKDEDVNLADEIFIKRLNKNAKDNPFQTNIFIEGIAGTLMSIKTNIDRLPFVRSERWYVNYEENKNRPERIRETLISIQNQLKDKPKLNPKSVDFIFQDNIREALSEKPTIKEEPIEPPEEPIEPPEEPSADPLKLENEDVATLLEAIIPEEEEEEPIEEEPSSSDRDNIQALEKVIQDVKLKEAAEDLKNIEEQAPGDYRNAPTSNRYGRPRFDEQWLDLEKLKQLQDPNFKKQEENLWFQNWNTPNQFGEGNITNKVIVDSLTEKIARLEHQLRFERANKGLPADERPPGRLFGEATERRGILQSPFPRYEAERRLDINMDRYQHMTPDNARPNRLINREQQQFELTQHNPGRQRIYDELNKENINQSEFKPRTQSELQHLYRRIRKR